MPLLNFATIDSGYGQLQGEVFPGLTLTGGERFDRHNQFGGHSTGAVAAAWTFNDSDTTVRSSFSQGFKAPSLYQLYSDYGNRALRPEAGESWDLGVEQHVWERRLMFSTTYYQRYSRDLIEFFECLSAADCLTGAELGYYANVARAAAHGVELQAAAYPTDQLTLAANYTLTDTEDKSVGSPGYGQELLRRPKNAANASLSYRWSQSLTTIVDGRYAGPSFDNPGTGRVQLGGYALFNVRLSYSLGKQLELYGRVENATGKHYETAYEYGTLGRVAYAGVRASF
jgi:vitamin B12 transporter